MAPVPSSFPSSLSASRAGDFMQCPLLFRFRAIDRLPEEQTVAQLRGTLVHAALEDVFDLPAASRNGHAVLALADDALKRLEETDPDAARTVHADGPFRERIEPLIRTYFTLEDPRRLEPHAREIGFNVGIDDDFALRGFIDRVDVAADGAVRIVDYKTGKSPRAGYEDKAMFQMRFYALAWWREHGVIPKMLQLLFLGNGQALRHSPDQGELEAAEGKVLALRDAIAQSADSGQFEAKPSKLCDWCSHRAMCPAFDGTPPALPPRDLWPSASRFGGSPQAGDGNSHQ